MNYGLKKLVLRLGLSVFPVLFCSCVSTSLLYNPHLYHDGRSIARDKTQVQLAVATMPNICSSDNYQENSPPTIHTEYGDQSSRWVGADLGLRVGLNDVSDIGINGHLGLGMEAMTRGARVLYTRQLTPAGQPFAASLVPALSYVRGGKSSDDINTIWSNVIGVELHAPMSYRLHRRFDLTWGPQVIYLHYLAHLDYGAQGTYQAGSRSLRNDLICPGLSFGFRFGVCYPQMNFLYMRDRVTVTGGIALNFGGAQ